MTLSIVRTGTWLYGGTAETPVDVIALNYDWWYCLAELDGQLEPGENAKSLGPDGCLYYVRFRRALEPDEPTWPDSEGYATIIEAMAHAECKVEGGVKWRVE